MQAGHRGGGAGAAGRFAPAVSNGMRRVFPGAGLRPARRPARGLEVALDRQRRGRRRAARSRSRADADGHPGYLATARMMGEAGLLLAEPGATPSRAGFLTPATALGTAGADRFENARLRFSVG